MNETPYSKEYIIQKINEEAEQSIILKGKTYEGVWTVNELLYNLERIMELNFDLNFSLNEVSGMCIPCDRGPYFVSSQTRAEHIKIIDIEPYDISPTNAPKWLYLLIVEKINKEEN